MNTNALDSAIRTIATASISGYQKHLSPRKGFSCAYRLLHGGESCSQYVKRMIAQEGLFVAVKASRQRFQACRDANHILRARNYLSSSDGNNEKRDKKAKSTQPESTNCQNLLDCGDCPIVEIPNCVDCSSGLDCGSLDCGGLDCGGCGG